MCMRNNETYEAILLLRVVGVARDYETFDAAFLQDAVEGADLGGLAESHDDNIVACDVKLCSARSVPDISAPEVLQSMNEEADFLGHNTDPAMETTIAISAEDVMNRFRRTCGEHDTSVEAEALMFLREAGLDEVFAAYLEKKLES